MILTYIGVFLGTLLGSVILCGALVRIFQREIAYLEQQPFGIRLAELSDWKTIRDFRIASAGSSFGVESIRRFAHTVLETTTLCCTCFPTIVFNEDIRYARSYPSLAHRTPLIGLGPEIQNIDEKTLTGLIAWELARYSRQFMFWELLSCFLTWRPDQADEAVDMHAARFVGSEPVIASLEELRDAARKENNKSKVQSLEMRIAFLRFVSKSKGNVMAAL